MATITSVAAGKSSNVATWSNAKKAEAGNDYIVTGFSVEWNSTGIRVRSIEVTASGGLTGSTDIQVGASTAGSNGTTENLLVKFAAGAAITWKASLNILSTFTTTPQTVSTGGHAIVSLKLVETNTAKVSLTEALAANAGSGQTEVVTGTLETGNFTHTFTQFVLKSGGTLACGTTTFKTAAGGVPEIDLSAGTLTGGSGLTIELEAETGEVLLNARSIAALVVNAAAKNSTLTPGAGGCTIGALTLNTKGAIVGKGFKIRKEQRLTVTGVISLAGTEAEPTRIESTEAGKAAKLKVVEQEVTGWLNFQDLAIETGVLYLPHGTAVSGDTEAGVTYKLEAKPSASVGLGMIV